MRQREKNTVSAKDQTNGKGCIFYVGEKKDGIKVLFAGNSITLHGVKEEIGWHVNWGMAASDISKDYVHIIVGNMRNEHPNATFCIASVGDWELNYLNGENELERYAEAREFNADIIVVRCIENCPAENFDSEKFGKEYKKLIDYLNKDNNAEIIVTTGFWKHPGDDKIREVAKENGYKTADLGDLGELDEMKAVGLFEHSGVANHPGDKGMDEIAKRIYSLLD